MLLNSNELSFDEVKHRSLYKFLRTELSRFLVEFSLVDSFANHINAGVEYKFVDKRELKPRAKVTESENAYINSFILIFFESSISSKLKKNIRFFDDNKITRENIIEQKIAGLDMFEKYQKQMRYFDNTKFYNLLKGLLKVDYATLLQRDLTMKTRSRYALTHYHVRIDHLLDAAAESLGKELRYISKDLYENGEDYAKVMTEKLFEYYSFHHSVSGRRTAAILAAQLLKEEEFLSTVYVSSSESRTMTVLMEKGVKKYALIKLDNQAIEFIEKHPKGTSNFRNQYLIYENSEYGVAVLRVFYLRNESSRAPSDGKLREVKSDLNWLKVEHQAIMPRYDKPSLRPIKYQIIYDQADPLS